jgi:integrase/recombinase XerD
MHPTITLVQDTRRAKDKDKYPMKLRVTYERVQKYFLLGIDLTKDEYENVKSTKTRKDLADNKLIFDSR